MNVEKIYFDMDDTIADFGLGLQEICGITPIPQDIASDEWTDNMWESVKNAGDFYYKLKEYEPGMILFWKMREVYGNKVEILSAIPKPRRGVTTAEIDKKRWVKDHISNKYIGRDTTVNITKSAEDKRLFAKDSNCILIDDLKSNIDDWERSGGTGVLFFKDNPQRTLDEILILGLLNSKNDGQL